MQFTSKAIVLHQVKYSDSAVIATFFTAQYGIKSFIVRGVRSGRSAKSRRATLQPLALVEVTGSHREKGGLTTLRDIRIYQIYSDLTENPMKISVALFLQEVLYKSIREESPDLELYAFLEDALVTLDKMPVLHDFHLIFLIRLSRYFGFFPSGNASPNTPVFSLSEGCFVPASRVEFALNLSESQLLSNLKEANLTDKVLSGNQQRRAMLRALIKFFQIHLEGMGAIRSLAVFESMFSENLK